MRQHISKQPVALARFAHVEREGSPSVAVDKWVSSNSQHLSTLSEALRFRHKFYSTLIIFDGISTKKSSWVIIRPQQIAWILHRLIKCDRNVNLFLPLAKQIVNLLLNSRKTKHHLAQVHLRNAFVSAWLFPILNPGTRFAIPQIYCKFDNRMSSTKCNHQFIGVCRRIANTERVIYVSYTNLQHRWCYATAHAVAW